LLLLRLPGVELDHEVARLQLRAVTGENRDLLLPARLGRHHDRSGLHRLEGAGGRHLAGDAAGGHLDGRGAVRTAQGSREARAHPAGPRSRRNTASRGTRRSAGIRPVSISPRKRMAGRITVGSVWSRATSTLYPFPGVRHDFWRTV